MFSTFAGMYMATKVHFSQMKAGFATRKDKQVSEMVYRSKVNKSDEKEKYQRSLLPKSGYMTLEEYESSSRAMTKKEISAKLLDKADLPKDDNYIYVPQHVFKLVKYNDPVGSPELSLPRKLQFDRQINAQGIVSGDYTKLVYPSVYYYAEPDCVSCDLFLINLDQSLPDIDKVKKANVLNKEPKPLISTSKDIDTKFVFRTLTPIDFSADNTKLAVKEKIGYKHDGIWKTELWVYDFNTGKAKKLNSIREAIVHYWKEYEGVNLNDNRWDIYPMGFDANDDNRIIVCAYAYTGNVPKFLGTWSIDASDTSAKLETMRGFSVPVSTVGYRLSEEHDVKPISELEFDAKREKIEKKAKEKQEAKDKKHEELTKKIEYRRKIHQIDMETRLNIRQRQEYLKSIKPKKKEFVTDNLGQEDLNETENTEKKEKSEK